MMCVALALNFVYSRIKIVLYLSGVGIQPCDRKGYTFKSGGCIQDEVRPSSDITKITF